MGNTSLTLGQVQQVFNSEFEKYKKQLNLDISAVSEVAVAAVMRQQGMPQRTHQFNGQECQICGKLGHKADRCFQRFSQNFNNPNANRYSGNQSNTGSGQGNYYRNDYERGSYRNDNNNSNRGNWRSGNTQTQSGNDSTGQQGRSGGPLV